MVISIVIAIFSPTKSRNFPTKNRRGTAVIRGPSEFVLLDATPLSVHRCTFLYVRGYILCKID